MTSAHRTVELAIILSLTSGNTKYNIMQKSYTIVHVLGGCIIGLLIGYFIGVRGLPLFNLTASVGDGEWCGDGTCNGVESSNTCPGDCDEPPLPPGIGACLLPDGVCFEISSITCWTEINGEKVSGYHQENQTCDEFVFNDETGTWELKSDEVGEEDGGGDGGGGGDDDGGEGGEDGSTEESGPSPGGACCIGNANLPPQSCAYFSIAGVEMCAKYEGRYLGDGTTCDGNPCDDPGSINILPIEVPWGACCRSSGCEDAVSEEACPDGAFYPNQDCVAAYCLPAGGEEPADEV
jgi:hypothetical protein